MKNTLSSVCLEVALQRHLQVHRCLAASEVKVFAVYAATAAVLSRVEPAHWLVTVAVAALFFLSSCLFAAAVVPRSVDLIYDPTVVYSDAALEADYAAAAERRFVAELAEADKKNLRVAGGRAVFARGVVQVFILTCMLAVLY